MYPVPPPIIFIQKSEPSKCPNCHKTEDKKEVCKHCDYVYKDTQMPTGLKWYFVGVIISFVVILAYLLITKSSCYRGVCGYDDIFLSLILSIPLSIVFPITILVYILMLLVNLM